MDVPIRTGELHAAHRGRLASILHATSVFSDAEVGVALELFDEAVTGSVTRDAGPEPSPARPGRDAMVSRPAPRVPLPAPSPDYLVLGAFTPEDELVGYACYGPTPETDRTFDLYWIAVDPSAHGTGIGTLLLSEVERRLQGQDARLVVVETSSRSEYAGTRAFYAARGYRECARVRGFYAPGDDRITLSKRFHHTRPRGEESSHHE